jgi:hypothetical protein
MQRRLARRLAAGFLLAAAAALAAEREPIPETKRQLMLDLFELTGGGRSEDQLMVVLLAQLERSQGAMIEQGVAGTSGLSPEAQVELRAQLTAGEGFLAKLRRRLPGQIDFERELREAALPSYDSHFEQQDLRAMVAFYRTRAGRKAALLPGITLESIQEAAEAVQPQVLALVQEIIAEEAALLTESESG